MYISCHYVINLPILVSTIDTIIVFILSPAPHMGLIPWHQMNHLDEMYVGKKDSYGVCVKKSVLISLHALKI